MLAGNLNQALAANKTKSKLNSTDTATRHHLLSYLFVPELNESNSRSTYSIHYIFFFTTTAYKRWMNKTTFNDCHQ